MSITALQRRTRSVVVALYAAVLLSKLLARKGLELGGVDHDVTQVSPPVGVRHVHEVIVCRLFWDPGGEGGGGALESS